MAWMEAGFAPGRSETNMIRMFWAVVIHFANWLLFCAGVRERVTEKVGGA